MRYCVALLLCLQLFVPALANAWPENFVLRRGLSQLEAAYLRYHAVTSDSGDQPLAATSVELTFPEYGFAPRNLIWSLERVSDDQSRILLAIPVHTFEQWRGTIRELSNRKYRPATSTFGPAAAYSAPVSLPAHVYAFKLLDRRDSVVPVTLPTETVITGVNATAQVQPAVELIASPHTPATVTISVFNSREPVLIDGEPAEEQPGISVIDLKLRPGFTATHDCIDIKPKSACDIQLSYLGQTPGSLLVDNLKVTFDTDEFAVISLVGKTKNH